MIPPRGTSLRATQSHQESGDTKKDLSAIHGDFIAVSTPKEQLHSLHSRRQPSPARYRSRSPERRQVDRGVHLHLSLTDSQMDKLASTISTSSPRPKSSRRGVLKNNNTNSSDHFAADNTVTPVPQFKDPFSPKVPHRGNHNNVRATRRDAPGRDAANSTREDTTCSPLSPTQRSRSPAKRDSYGPNHSVAFASPSIIDRRGGPRLPPINVEVARQLDPSPSRQARKTDQTRQYGSIYGGTAPETPPGGRRQRDTKLDVLEDSSSVYSDLDQPAKPVSPISPLRINKSSENAIDGEPERRPSVLQEYTDWIKSSPTAAVDQPAACLEASRAKDIASPESSLNTDVGDREDVQHGRRNAFSPLAPLYDENSGSAPRKGRKVLVGHNGWLERTGPSAEKKESPPKKGSIFDVIKKMAKEVADMTDMRAARRAKEVERGRQTARLNISLDPREQSLLYCELEFILTSAIHSYINSQFNAGRLDADKYKRIVDGWQQKGRPRVIGFRYDLETQLELIHLHLLDFKFYGGRSGASVAMGGMLDMMKVNARAMRIRTFCQPDSVIAKQLFDSQNLFNILGCSEQQQIQLAEVIQFFKTILEREKYFRTDSIVDKSSTTPARSHVDDNRGHAVVDGSPDVPGRHEGRIIGQGGRESSI